MFNFFHKFYKFNKEYSKFESIMSDLLNKTKKSTQVVQKYEENAEVYELDTVDIVFELRERGYNKIYVMDKNGAQIIALDCHYDDRDKLQNEKWYLFSDFLREVRDTYNKRIVQAKKAQEVKQQVISAQAAKEKMLDDALEKLRGL